MYLCFWWNLVIILTANYLLPYSSKLFYRWMNGTCIETPPQKIPGEDEPFIFSFFTDISGNQEVIGLVQTVQNNMKNSLTSLTRYLTRWKKYRGVWKVDKVRPLGRYLKLSFSNLMFRNVLIIFFSARIDQNCGVKGQSYTGVDNNKPA